MRLVLPEPWPIDAASTAPRLLALIRELDEQDDDALLVELALAAWPCHWAERQ